MSRSLLNGGAVLIAVVFVAACGKSSEHDSASVGVSQQRLDVRLSFSFPAQQSLFQTVAYAYHGMHLGPGARIRARDGQVGNGADDLHVGTDVRLGDRAQLEIVSVFGGGDTYLGPRAHVAGFLESALPVHLGPGAVVDEGIRSPTATLPPRSFTIDTTFPVPAAGIRVGPNRTTTLAPGAYEELDAGPKSRIQLSSGRYYFGEVRIGADATLDIDDTNGEVLVFVGGTFRYHGQATFRKGPEQLAVVVTGSGSVELHVPFGGTVLAPAGDVHLGPAGSLAFEGAIIGDHVDIGPNDTVKLRPFAGWGALLCGAATGPTVVEARSLPPTCTKAAECCSPELQRVGLGDTADSYDVAGPNRCVVAGKGDDRITGCKMSGSFVLGGEGNDDLQLGQGVVAYGGPGNDRIESFGNATLFGNDGDDVLIAHSGTNVIFPGPGKDEIQTGGGDDTVVLFDACEATSGKIIDLGAGQDTVISPLTRAELETCGITLIGVEEVRVESDACRSECRNPPNCVAGGTCVVQADATLGCSCPPWATGPTCATHRDLPYVAEPPPSLDGADEAARIQQARRFISWFLNGAVGSRDAARTALDGTRGNIPMREAFAVAGRTLLASPIAEEQLAAVDVLGYLQCRACTATLIEFFPASVPNVPTADNGNDAKTRARAVQSGIARQLAGAKTRRGKTFLLEQLARHSDNVVRKSIIFALSQAYGEPIRGTVAAIARPEDMIAFDWLSNDDPNFDAKLRARNPR